MQKVNDLLDYIETKPKVFIVDWSVYSHRGIYAHRFRKDGPPSTYYTFNSIFTNLKDLKPRKEDLIILALDSYGKGNWRRDFDSNYKANRQDNRNKQTDIDWSAEFKAMNSLLDNINISTPFIPIQIDRLEADDIISYVCRYFKDRDCIVLTIDSDMNQLYALGNVKVYSPKTKKIREVKNPLGELAKKIKKETADNLVTPITNEIEYQRRKTIVNLLQLPDEIDAVLHKVISNIKPKTNYNTNLIKFQSIRKKFNTLYVN